MFDTVLSTRHWKSHWQCTSIETEVCRGKSGHDSTAECVRMH